MRTCPNCEALNEDGAVFCVACGSHLGSEAVTPPENSPLIPATPPEPLESSNPEQPPGYYNPFPPTSAPAIPPRSTSKLPALGAAILLIACFLPWFDLNRVSFRYLPINPAMLGFYSEAATFNTFEVIYNTLTNTGQLFGESNVDPSYIFLTIYFLSLVILPLAGIYGLFALRGTEKSTQNAVISGKVAFWMIIFFWSGLVVIPIIYINLNTNLSMDFGEIAGIVFSMIGFGVPVALVGAGLQWLLK